MHDYVSRTCRYLKEQYTLAFYLYRHNLTENEIISGMLRHVLFQLVESNLTIFERCTNYLTLLVPYTKDDPSAFTLAKICFVAQRRKIFTEFINVKGSLCFLKLDNFAHGMFP